MNGTILNFVTAIGAVGTFCTGIAAVIGLLRYFRNLKFKEEYCYGKEAESRLETVERILKRGPDFDLPYGGGTIIVPRFEVRKFVFDSDTMEPSWAKYSKTVRFYYNRDGGETMVKGWRL